MQHPLFQKLICEGAELDIGLFRKMTYIEIMDLSGPRLILHADDKDRILRDDFNVVEGSIIAASISDAPVKGSLSTGEAFKVKAVNSDANDNLVIECVAAAVDALKDPAEDALFMVKKSVEEILGAATGLALDVGSFPLIDAWHLLPGERTTRKLRMLARELGALIWYSRGKLHMHTIKGLWALPKVKTFHHDDRRKDVKDQISDYELIYRKGLIVDRVKRGYAGWEITKGNLGGGALHEETQYHQTSTLSNLNESVTPAIDMAVLGQGHLEPSQKVELKFHRSMQGRPFDESIPEEVMIHTIASQQERDQYRTRIKGVIYSNE